MLFYAQIDSIMENRFTFFKEFIQVYALKLALLRIQPIAWETKKTFSLRVSSHKSHFQHRWYKTLLFYNIEPGLFVIEFWGENDEELTFVMPYLI